MKISTKKNILIQFFLLLSCILICFVSDTFSLKDYLYVLVIIIAIIATAFFQGTIKLKNSYTKQMSLAVLIFTFLFQTIIFILFGLKLGLARNPYNYGFNYFFKLLIPSVLSIVSLEIFRNYIIEKGKTEKINIMVVTITIIIIESLMSLSLYSFDSLQGIFEYLLFAVFPLFISNIFLSILTYYFGCIPSIIYRLIMELTIIVSPLYPELGDYILSAINIIIPLLMLLFVLDYTKNKKKEKKYNIVKVNKFSRVLNYVITIFMIPFFLLMSGLFKFSLIVVGSGSMEPNLLVGDLVLLEKYDVDEFDKIKEGEILVFNMHDKTVIHRIASIDRVNDTYSIVTKGDNNKERDNWIVTNENIIGVAKKRIPYLGYPSILLHNLLGG